MPPIPDDETLGCGGTLAKHVQNGDDVFVTVMADNYRSPKIYKDFRKAMEVLGVRKHEYLGLPDSQLETFTILKLTRQIEDIIEEQGIPDIVYTHYENDLSIDHRLTFQVTLTAFRPIWGKPISIYSFESPSGSEWGAEQFSPNYFVDINETLLLKLEALACYKTEMRPFPHPRSEESIISRAKMWGSQCGLLAAEAFKTIRAYSMCYN